MAATVHGGGSRGGRRISGGGGGGKLLRGPLPSFSDEKFEAALEQSRLLPLPTKDLLERIGCMLRSAVPFTFRACKDEIANLRDLAAEVVDGKMFDTAPGVSPLRRHLHTAADAGALFNDTDVPGWKEGRKNIAKIRALFAELVRPFSKYAVEWENSRRGRAHQFGMRRGPGDGAFYQGQWDSRTGLRQGVGAQRDAHGTYYEGGFVDDKPTGDGCRLLMADGRRVEGSVVGGVAQGQATIYRPDGGRYVGSVRDGEPHGTGTMFEPTGCSYRGAWKKGLRSGSGEAVDANGAIFRGPFAENRRHGTGELALPGGGVVQGTWRKGKLKSIDSVELPSGAAYRGSELQLATAGDNGGIALLHGVRVEVVWPAAVAGGGSGVISAVVAALDDDSPSGNIDYNTSKGVSGQVAAADVAEAVARAAPEATPAALRTTGWWTPVVLRLIQEDEAARVDEAKPPAAPPVHRPPALQQQGHQHRARIASSSAVDDDDVSRYGAHAYHVQGRGPQGK